MDDHSWSGGCLCGGVRYQVSGELRDICGCHCTQCKKTSGHYVAATQAYNVDLTITETSLSWYASSKEAERGFCRKCGGNLFWRKHGSPLTSIMAGTLDDTKDLKMTSQLYGELCASYLPLPDVEIIDQSNLRYELAEPETQDSIQP